MDLGVEETAREIVDAAVQIHRRLGPGLLESAYEAVLHYEMEKRGLQVLRQVELSLTYDDLVVERAYCMDFLVNDSVVIELKASERISSVHYRQLLTYLKVANVRVGLLINFGQPTLKQGLHRVVNGY
jgi:GxxExxY protein